MKQTSTVLIVKLHVSFQFSFDGDQSLYKEHIAPLVYTCALVLPLAYIIGLIFTLKTHKEIVHDAFMAKVDMGRCNN